MKNNQLTFIHVGVAGVQSETCKESNTEKWKLCIDGASRNNPGPSGAGLCLSYGEETVFEQGFFLGTRTNNQAEYFALLAGLFFAHEFLAKKDQLVIYSDSQLLVRQMNGIYKVRDPILKKMQEVAFNLCHDYNVTFCHIYREYNVRADFLANRGVDKLVPLPKKFVDMLRLHDVE